MGYFNPFHPGPIYGTSVYDSCTNCTTRSSSQLLPTTEVVHSRFNDESSDHAPGCWGQCELAKKFLNTYSQFLYLTHCRLGSNLSQTILWSSDFFFLNCHQWYNQGLLLSSLSDELLSFIAILLSISSVSFNFTSSFRKHPSRYYFWYSSSYILSLDNLNTLEVLPNPSL